MHLEIKKHTHKTREIEKPYFKIFMIRDVKKIRTREYLQIKFAMGTK